MKPHSQSRESARLGPCLTFATFLAFSALLLFALALLFSSGMAPVRVEASTNFSVAQPVTPTEQLDATQPLTPVATLPPVDPSDAPPPVTDDSGAVPGAQQTARIPQALVTNEAGTPVVPPPSPVPSVGPANPGTQPPPADSGQGGTFPWWPLGLILLAAIAGAGFMLARSRTATTATTASTAGTTARVAGGDEVTSTTIVEPNAVTTASARATAAPPPIAVTTAAVAPVVTTGPAPEKPSEVTCPNCGTTNKIEENFCHECGEDLRAAQTAALAAAAAATPVAADVDIDTLPYLETLDRVDEQLEYVLSRPRVLIGTAQGNDIVINADFKGYESVSPVHAELRRDEEGYVVRDRESERGTFVNDARTGESVLSNGDTLRLGEVKFVFRVPE